MVYISFALLPFVLFAFVISGYIFGTWCVDKDARMWGMFWMFVASAVCIAVSISMGTETNTSKGINPANIPAMLGLNCGSISMMELCEGCRNNNSTAA